MGVKFFNIKIMKKRNQKRRLRNRPKNQLKTRKKSNESGKPLWKDWKRLLKILAVVFAGLFLAGTAFVLGLFVYYAKDLPNPEKINKRVLAESTKIYDRTGEHLLYEIYGEEKRTAIKGEDIPDTVKYAMIVLEDRSFYDHHGVDFRGIARAAWVDLVKREAIQGASTINQQFIKNSILTSKKKYSRKIKEIILAIEIDTKFKKDEILRMYLNEIPFGSNAYGIESAAQTFFGIHAKELTLAQSALLASLPNAPSYFSPHGSNTERLLKRWSYALDQMAEHEYITKEQAEAAKNEDILAQVKPLRTDIRAPHFALYVKEKLVEEFGEEEIQKKGLKVYTTLDWDVQQIAEQAVKEGVEANGEKYGFSNAALVAVNPKNGQVLSMVGSKDYFDETIDGYVNVATRLRQPGSSFKPYVYAQAFSEGYRPETILFDVKTNFGEDGSGKKYKPQNYDGRYRGPVEMKKALATSLNVPAVKALYLAGIKDSIRLAKSMGITTLREPERYGLSLVLGGGEVMLLDHVGAFGVFANTGIKHDQKVILRVEDAKGEKIKSYEMSKGRVVLDKKVAAQMCEILSDNQLRTSAFGASNPLHIPEKNVIAKTGTTNEYRDGWLVGSTPSIAAGVWAGNNDNTAMKQGAAGANVAGPIWNKFMTDVLENYQNEEFEKYEDEDEDEKEDKKGKDKPVLTGKLKIVEKIEVCEYDDDEYCLANSKCPDDEDEDKKFFVGHTILYYLNKNDPLGKSPKNPKDDPQFTHWEEAVLEWGKDHADGKGRRIAPTKECKSSYF